MNRFFRRLFLIAGILTTVAGLAYCITRFLLATDVASGTDSDTKFGIKHEPIRRNYTHLNLHRD
ncbi:MAG: hypothetical protein KBT19_00725 [Lachnospiraceae bacterium]|nr:hypothetical protein [Candidatus Colinaster equi]